MRARVPELGSDPRSRAPRSWPYLLFIAVFVFIGVMFGRSHGSQADIAEDPGSIGGQRGRWMPKLRRWFDQTGATQTRDLGLQPRTLVGHVFDAPSSDTPIEGARVCAFLASPMGGRPVPPRCARTDARGAYALDVPAWWRPIVRASATGRRPIAPDGVGPVDVIAAAHSGDLDFHLDSEGVKVEGIVVDATGGVIEGAEVFSTLSDPRYPPPTGLDGAVTDASGRFELWLEGGDAALTASAHGYGSASRWGRYPEPGLRIALAPESRIEGVVVDARTGAAVADAQVTAGASWGPDRMTTDDATRTDQEGRFVLIGLSPGRYRVSARGSGVYGEATQVAQLGVGGTYEGLVVEVAPAGDVSVRVTRPSATAASGGAPDPCAAGSVTLTDLGGMPWAAKTDDDGVARMPGVLPGIYDVIVDCQGQRGPMPWPTINVAEGARVDLDVHLRAGHTVEGHVVDERGAPVSGVMVSVNQCAPNPTGDWSSGVSQPSDAEGRFSISGLGSVEHDIYSYGTAVLPASAPPQRVTVGEAPRTTGVTVVVVRGAALAGRVVDRQGRGVVNLYVVAREGESVVASAVTDASGAFELGAMQAGEVDVEVFRSAADAWGESLVSPFEADDEGLGPVSTHVPRDALARAEVALTVSDKAEVELIVELERGTIRGCVVDDEGAAIPDAWIWASPDWDGSDYSRDQGDGLGAGPVVDVSMHWASGQPAISTGIDGCFVLGDLGEGAWELYAQDAAGDSGATRGVRLGDTAEIVIERGGGLEGTVTGPDGPVTRFAVAIGVGDSGMGAWHTEEFVSPRGHWKIDHLPEGTHSVSIESIEGSSRHTITVERDRVVHVDASLPGSAAVSGRVLDADGKPHEGVTVYIATLDMNTRFAMSSRPVTTGPDGRFVAAAVAAGSLLISAAAPIAGSQPGGVGTYAAPVSITVAPGQHANAPDIQFQSIDVGPWGPGGLVGELASGAASPPFEHDAGAGQGTDADGLDPAGAESLDASFEPNNVGLSAGGGLDGLGDEGVPGED